MSSAEPADAVYYRHAGRVSLFNRLSRRARRDVFETFMRAFSPGPDDTILDVGVSLDLSKPEANVLEQLYPHRERLTCAGLGDGEALRRAYPGIGFERISPGEPLPFADRAFDIAYCNAVLEHAGSRAEQRAFLRELCRVAGRCFVAVPNPLFPVEHHTGLPLLHYLPVGAFRFLVRRLGFAYWAEERHLNPLGPRELKGLFPDGAAVRLAFCGLGAGRFKSNLVAIR